MTQLEKQLFEALRESHAASAALMRVVWRTMAMDVMETEFEISGIPKGFGVRAQAALDEYNRQAELEQSKAPY